MTHEKYEYHKGLVFSFLRNNLKENKLYEFKTLLEIIKKTYPDIQYTGVLLNNVIEQLEVTGELYRYVKNDDVGFLTTKNFEESFGLVEWQNDRRAIVYELNDNKNKNGKMGLLSYEESESVIDGDIITIKHLPDEFKEEGYEYIVINRIFKSSAHFVGKIVEIEEVNNKKISKCVLLEKNFRYPFVLEEFNDEESIPYHVGDFIEGEIFSDTEFKRGEELSFQLRFKSRLGNIEDSKIESLLAFKWMNIKKHEVNNDLLKSDIENALSKENIEDKNRVDLTNFNFISVDSAESKDLDDAIFVMKEKNNRLKVYIAISDVSYFIEQNSVIDELASYKNQTYYFPHRIHSMLPKKLSEDVLSLHSDGKNKKVMICEIILDESYNIYNYEFYSALIKNYARLTYNDIDYYAEKNNCLDMTGYNKGSKKVFLNEDDHATTDLIELLLNLTQNLRKKRNIESGLYYDEFFPVLNSYNGKVDKLKIKPRNTISGNMIEELMLLANKCASDLFVKNKVENGIFRNQTAPLFGSDKLPSAKYESVNNKHYALKFDSYTHFTSPVRRYIDIKVHRLIKEIIGEESKKLVEHEKHNEFLSYTNKVSRRFKQAQKKVIKWLVVEYLKEIKEKYFKAKIIADLKEGWIVELVDINFQSYVKKPKDLNEVKYLEEKDFIVVELSDIDFCKERLNLKIKNDKII